MAFSAGDRVTVQAGVHAGLGAEVVYSLKSGKYFVIVDGFSTTDGQRVYREQSLKLEIPDPDPDPEPTATWYVSTTGDDGNAGTVNAPLASFAAAYAKANAGDVVEVAAGTYGYQTLMRDESKDEAAQRIVFRPAKDAHVELAGLGIGGRSYDGLGAWHVELHDMTVHGALDVRRAQNIVLINCRLNLTFCFGAKDVQYLGGEWGIDHPSTGTHPEFQAFNRPGNQVACENILIEGVVIHHIGRPLGREDVHTNALHFWSSGPTHKNLTVKGCHFHHNDVFSSLINDVDGVLMENNTFEPSTNTGFQGEAFYSVMIGSGTSNVTFKGNRFDQQPSLNPGPTEGVTACGNTGEVPDAWKQACA